MLPSWRVQLHGNPDWELQLFLTWASPAPAAWKPTPHTAVTPPVSARWACWTTAPASHTKAPQVKQRGQASHSRQLKHQCAGQSKALCLLLDPHMLQQKANKPQLLLSYLLNSLYPKCNLEGRIQQKTCAISQVLWRLYQGTNTGGLFLLQSLSSCFPCINPFPAFQATSHNSFAFWNTVTSKDNKDAP